MKKIFIILFCVLISVLIGLLTVLLIVKSVKAHPVSNTSELWVSSETETQKFVPFLKITAPQKKNITVTESQITFKGNTNITNEIKLNEKEISADEKGDFSITESLEYGNNKFVLTAGSITKTFTVYRKYTVAKDFTPKTEQKYSAGANFSVSVTARAKAKVTATFNKKTITLTPSSKAKADEFVKFEGNFSLPSGHFKDLDLGKITFKCSYKGFSDTLYSKNIICKKEDVVVHYDANATPTDKKYVNVGSGIITEIVGYQAETFLASDKKDTSRPYCNYLPKGTLDYGSSDYITIKRDGETLKLITLRCGKMVYKTKLDKPTTNNVTIAKQYVGKLPDHNEIAFSSLTQNGSHTVLTLDTLWKAPFYFDLEKQNYQSDFTVTNITYNYVDITFCYASVFDGKITIPADNPLFSKAKTIKNKSDYTLRLYLKKTGGFYGWDCYYNSNNQLVFEFLNPAKITTAQNKYGANLSGIKVLIDVGHGGKDGGAVGKNGVSEASINLSLAQKVAKELKSVGATVYLTRSTDKTSSTDTKIKILKTVKPNYCLSIHHDYNNSSSLNGFGSYYYYPFSKKAAEFVLDNTFNTGIYKNKTFRWHYYFMGRTSVCPVVLTENGYLSNAFDLKQTTSNSVNTAKAEAITKGIVEYFTSIQ